MKKYRVAIIGYGRSGRDIHTNLLVKLPELYEIAYVVEKDAQRRDMAHKETGATALENYRELYNYTDFDFIINASFNMDHYPISLELLQKGYNVMSEKPAATNSAQLAEILEAAQKSGCIFQAFQQSRFGAGFRKIKEIIASGVLGRIVHVGLNFSGFSRRWDWQTIQAFSAGSLLNTGPHPVDHALELMGFPKDIQVSAAFDRAQTSGDAEDYAKLILQAEGAPVADVEISSCNAFSEYVYLVQGKYGTLRGTPKALEWKYYIEANEEKRPLITTPLKGENGEPLYCTEQLTFHTGRWEANAEELDAFNFMGLAFYRQFYKTLSEGIPMEITNDQIMIQMKVMEEAHRQNKAKLQPFVNL